MGVCSGGEFWSLNGPRFCSVFDGSTKPKLRLPKVKPWSQGEEANIEVVSDEEETEVASSSSARAPTLPPKPKIRTAPSQASGAVPAEATSPKASGAVPVKATSSKASGAVHNDLAQA